MLVSIAKLLPNILPLALIIPEAVMFVDDISVIVAKEDERERVAAKVWAFTVDPPASKLV